MDVISFLFILARLEYSKTNKTNASQELKNMSPTDCRIKIKI